VVAEKQKSLRALTSDNASQQRRLDKLARLVALAIAHLQSVTAAGRDEGVAESGRQMAAVGGKGLVEQGGHVIAEMVSEEQRLLKARELRESFQLRVTIPILLGCGVLAFSLVASAAFLLNREIELRRQAQVALQQAHDQVRRHSAELEAANK